MAQITSPRGSRRLPVYILRYNSPRRGVNVALYGSLDVDRITSRVFTARWMEVHRRPGPPRRRFSVGPAGRTAERHGGRLVDEDGLDDEGAQVRRQGRCPRIRGGGAAISIYDASKSVGRYPLTGDRPGSPAHEARLLP